MRPLSTAQHGTVAGQAAWSAIPSADERATRPQPTPATAEIWVDRIAVALTIVASAAYAWAAFAAAHRPYWMDEVLAVWTARQPGIRAVWEALRQGAEFSPPLYHLLLRAIVASGFDDHVALRLPSIVAVYLVALAAYALVRRRFSRPIACLALVVCLSGLLFSYAIQVRQYALVTACFALACALWDGPPERRVSPARALGIAVLLSAAIGMHFYAVLLAGTLALMEALWMLRYRRIRWPIVLALLAALISILPWLPIMQAARAYNLGDAASPNYYARPTIDRLAITVVVLLGGDGTLPAAPLAALVVLLVARFLARRPAAAAAPDLSIVTFAVCAIPVTVFGFSALVTGTFNGRYVIASLLGIGLVAAQWAAAHRRGPVLACCLIALSTGAILWPADARPPLRRQEALDLLAGAPDGLPIATGNGLRFFEIAEGARPSVVKRLVFLTMPNLDQSPDPTNAHQVERWARIDPGLPIRPIDKFLGASGEFLLLSDPISADLLPEDLAARGYVLTPIAERSGMRLDRVRRSDGRGAASRNPS